MDPNSTLTDQPARGMVYGCLLAVAVWAMLLGPIVLVVRAWLR